MPITIQFTGATAEEVAELVMQLSKVLPTTDLKQLPERLEVSTLDKPQAVEETKESTVQPEAEAKVKEKKPVEKKAENQVTLESIRSLLSQLSQSGKQAEVKQLIAAMGATRLTEIDPSNYAEMMEKALDLA